MWPSQNIWTLPFWRFEKWINPHSYSLSLKKNLFFCLFVFIIVNRTRSHMWKRPWRPSWMWKSPWRPPQTSKKCPKTSWQLCNFFCWVFGRIEHATISFSLNFLTFKEHWRPPMVLWRTKTFIWTAISSKRQRETYQFCQCFGIMDAHVPAQKCFRSVHAHLSKNFVTILFWFYENFIQL